MRLTWAQKISEEFIKSNAPNQINIKRETCQEIEESLSKGEVSTSTIIVVKTMTNHGHEHQKQQSLMEQQQK